MDACGRMLIQELPDDVKGMVVSHLQRQRCLKTARAVCRALRNAVDAFISEINVELDEQAEQLWQLAPLPLYRWTNCSRIHLTISVAHAQESVIDFRVGSVLALPFTKLAQEDRQRFRCLEISAENTISVAVLSMLLASLPAVQNVELDIPVSHAPLEECVLASALGSLQRLRKLGLYPGSALEQALLQAGGGLEQLTVYAWNFQAPIPASTCQSISRLQQLQRLRALGVRNAGDVKELLKALPASVRKVELPGWSSGSIYGYRVFLDLRLCLEGGFITELEVALSRAPPGGQAAGNKRLDLCWLDTIVTEELMPSGLLGRQLRRISLADPVLVWSLELKHVRPVLKQCPCLEVGTLRLDIKLSADAADEAVALLGGAPRCLQLMLECGQHIQMNWGAAASAPSSDAGGVQPAASVVDAPSLLSLAAERMLVAAAAAAAASSGGGAAAEGSGAAAAPGNTTKCSAAAGGSSGGGGSSGCATDAPAAGSSDQRRPPPLLLLNGPQLLEPAAMHGVVRQVAERAAPAVGVAAARDLIVYYIRLPHPPVPAAASVLLECWSEAGRTALMAASREIAAAAGAPPLEALPVPMPVQPSSSAYLGPAGVFGNVLIQVAQSVWEGEGISADWTQRQRLRWLLEQWSVARRQLGALSYYSMCLTP